MVLAITIGKKSFLIMIDKFTCLSFSPQFNKLSILLLLANTFLQVRFIAFYLLLLTKIHTKDIKKGPICHSRNLFLYRTGIHHLFHSLYIAVEFSKIQNEYEVCILNISLDMH